MKRIIAELSVDENILLESPNSSLRDRFEEEMGWVEQSGISLRDYRVIDEKFDTTKLFEGE